VGGATRKEDHDDGFVREPGIALGLGAEELWEAEAAEAESSYFQEVTAADTVTELV
jgi:hypothetical protein